MKRSMLLLHGGFLFYTSAYEIWNLPEAELLRRSLQDGKAKSPPRNKSKRALVNYLS